MNSERGRTYHHGDLRRVILDAALDVIATNGPGPLSLRDLARRRRRLARRSRRTTSRTARAC